MPPAVGRGILLLKVYVAHLGTDNRSIQRAKLPPVCRVTNGDKAWVMDFASQEILWFMLIAQCSVY